jgi:hypothetical protein
LESCVIFYLADTLIKQHNFPTLSLSLTINSLFFCGRHHSLSSAVVRATMGRGGRRRRIASLGSAERTPRSESERGGVNVSSRKIIVRGFHTEFSV